MWPDLCLLCLHSRRGTVLPGARIAIIKAYDASFGYETWAV